MKKIMLVGQSGTGKTSYVSYILNKRQTVQEHYPTVGVEAGVHVFEFDKLQKQKVDNKQIKQQQSDTKQFAIVNLWDSAGKHSFHDQICLKFYQDMDAFIILIDCSKYNTLSSVNYWQQKIRNVRRSSTGYALGVIANKSDKDKEFGQREFSNMYPGIRFYREISLREEVSLQNASKAQQALLQFIREQIFHRNLPTIHEGSLEDKNMKDTYCNCAMM